MGREQRRHKRYDVEGIEGSLVQNLEARILNISLTGMAIETTALLRVGANYFLRLPRESGELKLKADVKWCHLVRTEKQGNDLVAFYQAGIDFRDVLDERAQQVLEFIEEHVVVELERRLFGRFKSVGDETVLLDSAQEFVVRRLSLSGMLVETEADAEPGQLYELEMRPNGAPIEAMGRIAYAETLDGEPERNLLGVEFVELSSDSRRSLEAIIEGQLE